MDIDIAVHDAAGPFAVFGLGRDLDGLVTHLSAPDPELDVLVVDGVGVDSRVQLDILILGVDVVHLVNDVDVRRQPGDDAFG